MMLTIRRMIVIMILLVIGFFIYRGISPSGADTLLTNIKHIPFRFGMLSGKIEQSPVVSSGTIISGSVISGTIVSSSKTLVFTSTLTSEALIPLEALIMPSQETLVFTSTLLSGGLFSLDALVIPVQNTTIWDDISAMEETGGSLIIISDTNTTTFAQVEQQPIIPAVIPPKKTSISPKKPTVPSINKDISLLNNLFK